MYPLEHICCKWVLHFLNFLNSGVYWEIIQFHKNISRGILQLLLLLSNYLVVTQCRRYKLLIKLLDSQTDNVRQFSSPSQPALFSCMCYNNLVIGVINTVINHMSFLIQLWCWYFMTCLHNICMQGPKGISAFCKHINQHCVLWPYTTRLALIPLSVGFWWSKDLSVA